MAEKELYLIDASAYIHRAFHAIAPLTAPDGTPTNAVFGFIRILQRVIREKSPACIACAFDLKGPTFRHEIYPEYKANRPPMAEELAAQIPLVREAVAAHNIRFLEQDGFEADDLIASAARSLCGEVRVVIVSGDKDLLQLVDSRISMWDPMNDRFFDPAAVEKKFGVPPEKLLDFFALTGDSSDNIPGVAGIGPKTAAALINEFGGLDAILADINAVGKPGLRKKLENGRENAILSRDLIRLRDDLDVGPLEEFVARPPDGDRLGELYMRLGFSSLLKELGGHQRISHEGFSLLTGADELGRLLEEARRKRILVIDCETTSLDPVSAELVGIALCCGEDEAFYLPFAHVDDRGDPLPGQADLDSLRPGLAAAFADPDILKVGHNLKYDIQVLSRAGFEVVPPLACTLIASHLAEPERRSRKLDDLSLALLGRELTSFAEAAGDGGFARVGPGAARDYACEDVRAAFLLWRHYEPVLERDGLMRLFQEVEMALVPVLAAMELAGVAVDREALAALGRGFDRDLAELEAEIHRMAGREFNINSTKQLGEILFEELKLPHGRKTKTGYSTDLKVLEKLSRYHDLPAYVIRHRNLSKLKSTYIDGLVGQIHPVTGRIHSSFNQAVTATGRLSSSNPNLQNIPIRSPEGQKIRAAFVPAAGCVFVAADYSQIDLRVLAHYSGDAALTEAFRKGEDIHTRTAAEIFTVNPALVSPDMRRAAKAINFGIAYGMSAFGLAEELNISRREAKEFIERYFAHYPGVQRFMEDIVERARGQGFVTTLMGRRRYLPDIRAKNAGRRQFAERTAINTPIQGTAAEIIKLAMIAVEKRLRREGLAARQILQIHDEIVIEAPEKEAETVAGMMKEEMEQVMTLDVPLAVNVSRGRNLAEA